MVDDKVKVIYCYILYFYYYKLEFHFTLRDPVRMEMSDEIEGYRGSFK